jgi:hypothetical protein
MACGLTCIIFGRLMEVCDKDYGGDFSVDGHVCVEQCDRRLGW